MSNPEGSGDQPHRKALEALEKAVAQALDRLGELRTRAHDAESRSEELGELLQRFTGEPGEASLLLSRLEALEKENRELRGRLTKGRDGVERLLARIRFLEAQR